MITPSFGLTATERVLPKLALDWTTGLAQPGVDVTRAGVATFVGANGLIQSASADTQRIDWTTGVAGLLVEEQRTNLLSRSEEFNSTPPWNGDNSGGTNPIVTANQGIAPDGTLTADRIQLNRGAGTFSRLQQTIVTASAFYTFSVWLQLNNGTTSANVGIRVDGTGINCVVTNTWQRFSVTTVSATTNPASQILLFSTLGSDATADILAWGAQTEAGTFPTSYIPTELLAVTRNADVATMTGTNFSDWFNASEGTFVVDVQIPDTGAVTRRLISVNDTTVNNSFQLALLSSGNIGYYEVRDTNALQVSAVNGTVVVGNPFKTALAYKLDNYAYSFNGAIAGTDTSALVPTVTQMQIGFQGAFYANGFIRKIFYYPQRLTNAETQAFSK
jgi:hypothetical protein